MSHIHGVDRAQSAMFPALVDDYVGDNNPVRFIDAYVDSLRLDQLGFNRAEAKVTGRPPYSPSDLLKLYVYGYLNKVRSSRLLEQLTHRNIEVMWLLRKLQPDFKTIADFRKDNTEALKKVCREFTLLCKKLNLFGGELVTIDGSKFSAVNHDSRTYTKKKLQRLIKEINEKIETYFSQLDSADTRESTVRMRETHSLREHIAHLQEHKVELEELQKTLTDSGETQISLTDPDSRLMTTGKHGNDVCYNVQIAVDAKHKLILAHDVTNEANDLHQLEPMACAAKEILGVEHLDVTADKGYYNERQIDHCEQENISCYIPEPEKSQNKELGLFTDRDFRYNAQDDCYLCPANRQLTYRSLTLKGDKAVKIYESRACKQCLLRSRCTRSRTNNRRIYRWVNEHVIEAMRERMQRHPEKASQRKELAEHPFATIKHWMNHGYFLMRGKKNVAAEVNMSVLVYNMKRVLNILSLPALIAALQALSGKAASFFIRLIRQKIYSAISVQSSYVACSTA
jgi:transposase